MAPSFSKHAIIYGAIDYYCLVCENRFETKDITSKHILTTSHTENLEKTSYEVPEDCIRKIKLWYFCEFCNLLLKTKAKVKLHVTESKHTTNKANHCIKRYGESIVAFDKICINKEAWDGLCDGTCVICNCEFDNELEHSKNPMHNITLIQSHIELDNKNIYRMVDETSFHCMTCNSLKALPVSNHFDSLEHRTAYERCEQLATEILHNYKKNELHNKNNNENEATTATVPENVKTVEVTKDSASTIGKKKAAKQTSSIAMSNLILNINKIRNLKGFNIRVDEKDICKVLKANEYITRDEKGETWCILCDWIMDDFKVESHLNSAHHRNLLKLHELRIEKISNTAFKDDIEDKSNRPCEKKILNNNIAKPKSISTKKQLSPKYSKLLDSVNNIEVNNAQEGPVLNKTEENLTYPKESAIESKSDIMDQGKCSINDPETSDNRLKILNSIQQFQENDIKINFEMNSAMCKRCKLNLDFYYDVISKHIDQHKIAKDNLSKILDSVKIFQENNMNINFDMESAKCKKCEMNIDFNYNIIEKHILEHKKSPPKRKEVSSNVHPTTEESDYATVNNLKPVPGEKVVFCENCNKHIPFSLKNMKEHLNGGIHRFREIEKNKEKKVKLETVPLETFVRTIACIRNGIFVDDIINGELCINRRSNFLVGRVPEDNTYKCFYCNVCLSESETDDHIESEKHLAHISNVVVVTNMEDEFIRQINPDCYHCGFCNQIVYTWQDMESHLKTVTHREAKISAKWRLEEYSTVTEMKPIKEQKFSFSVLRNLN